jgi:3-oxoacyl-[acyl-carrier protein] reductase
MQYADLDKKRILITGASSGIGAATAELFARQRCQVGIHYHSSLTGAQNTLKRIEQYSQGFLLQADLRDVRTFPNLIKQFIDGCGGLDILVNNAGGLIKRQTIREAADGYYDNLFHTNLKHIFGLSREALPHLIEARGNIINIGSVAGHTGGAEGSGIYAAMKSAIATATIAMAREFASDGIRVNSVLPGFIDTPFHDGITNNQQKQEFLQKTPLGRFGTADDVANAIVFLASDSASYITGEYIAVNGGIYMRA